MGGSEATDRLERAEARLAWAETAIDDLRRLVVVAERAEDAGARARDRLRKAGVLAFLATAVVVAVVVVSRGRR